MIERTAGHAHLRLAPEHGGRVAQLSVGGRDLLVAGSGDDNPMLWGSFPMIPWAGRVRRGRFTFAGVTYELPLDLPPHAIHGTTYARPWDVEADGSLAIELGPDWPFGGDARQQFHLTPDALTCTIEVHAASRSMPAQAGWHPWFVRPVDLGFEATSHYVRDGDGIPTGELGPVPPGPWDDCFTDLLSPPQLAWPGGPTLTLTSTCAHWVVYDQPAHALCVEPQTGPPDGFTLAPQVVEPGAPLVASFTLHWG
jgi:aldose 1-epimerase